MIPVAPKQRSSGAPPTADGPADPTLQAIVCAGVIANHLRHTRGERVDIAWLMRNRSYARHIIELAKNCGSDPIRAKAQQLEDSLLS